MRASKCLIPLGAHNTRKLLKKENRKSNIQFKQSKIRNIGASENIFCKW